MSHNVAMIIRVRSCNNRRGGEESKDYMDANAVMDDYHDTRNICIYWRHSFLLCYDPPLGDIFGNSRRH